MVNHGSPWLPMAPHGASEQDLLHDTAETLQCSAVNPDYVREPGRGRTEKLQREAAVVPLGHGHGFIGVMYWY